MDMNGSKLVLESDGTLIDNNEIISLMQTEVLMLLEQNENWSPVNSDMNIFTASSSTFSPTTTLLSTATNNDDDR